MSARSPYKLIYTASYNQATTLRSLRAIHNYYFSALTYLFHSSAIQISIHKIYQAAQALKGRAIFMNQFTTDIQNAKTITGTITGTITKANDKLLWAFAVDATKPLKTAKTRTKRATQPKYKLHRYYVTSCSPRLRQFGVKVGMSYDQAKAIAPDMRIFVYNR